jgi:hypothetical protein
VNTARIKLPYITIYLARLLLLNVRLCRKIVRASRNGLAALLCSNLQSWRTVRWFSGRLYGLISAGQSLSVEERRRVAEELRWMER